MTRDEFKRLLDEHSSHGKEYDILSAWDAVVAERDAALAELNAQRVGVPLTADNADHARIVEVWDNGFFAHDNGSWWANGWGVSTSDLILGGATVLAWKATHG